MRAFNSVIAPLVFWFANRLFRSKIQQKSLKKHTSVMKLFRFAADNGHVKALSVYGHLLHFRGEGVDNRIQGAIYLQKAAEKGDVKAAYQMGRVYEQGFEYYFTQDPLKAFTFYQQAAKAGHQLSINRMIKAFSEGELGQSINQEKELYWLGKAQVFGV